MLGQPLLPARDFSGARACCDGERVVLMVGAFRHLPARLLVGGAFLGSRPIGGTRFDCNHVAAAQRSGAPGATGLRESEMVSSCPGNHWQLAWFVHLDDPKGFTALMRTRTARHVSKLVH